MTDNNNIPISAADNWLAEERARAALVESLHGVNKRSLFDVLHASGITAVVVTFDGYGDSGQIEDIEVRGAVTELPSVAIELSIASWSGSEVTKETAPLSQSIETLVYELLRDTHCGWENNEGAYGEFVFDVAARTITLDYNERFEDSEYTQHVF